MGLFSRKKPFEERYPIERVSHLPVMLIFALEMCVRENELDTKAVFESKFVGGYLIGYSIYLDDVDEKLAAAVRKMLFDGIFGPESGPGLFKASVELLLEEDPQVKRGWGAGVPDGERYFKSLEAKRDAINATASLETMFEVGLIDVSQQIL